MKVTKRMAAVLLFSGLALTATKAEAQTVCDFELGIFQQPLTGSYCGIDWGTSSGLFGNWDVYSWSQPPYNAHSGTHRVYNYQSVPSFSFLQPAQFLGAWFAGFGSMTFNMYNGSNLVATSFLASLGSTPTFLASNYGGSVTRVTAVGTPGNWIMDDVTYNTVPEPATIALLATGLVGLGGATYWRRRRTQ